MKKFLPIVAVALTALVQTDLHAANLQIESFYAFRTAKEIVINGTIKNPSAEATGFGKYEISRWDGTAYVAIASGDVAPLAAGKGVLVTATVPANNGEQRFLFTIHHKSGQWLETKLPAVTPKPAPATPTVPAAPKKATTFKLNSVQWDEVPGHRRIEMRVYQVGSRNPLYTETRSFNDLIWKLSRGHWKMTNRSVEIQFWEINKGIFEKDRKIGSVTIDPTERPGVYDRRQRTGGYDFTLTYRLD